MITRRSTRVLLFLLVLIATSNSATAQIQDKSDFTVRPVRLSSRDLRRKAIRKPRPGYPPKARASKAEGPVTVQVLVDEAGNVISAKAVSGHPKLRQAAVSAARSSKFSPTMLSGQAVKVTGVIVYNFVP
jgi:periplasmic protein TonB